MAYSTATPPKMLLQALAHKGPALWTYENTDSAATVQASGYITNGGDLGMKVNDILFYTITNGSPPGLYIMNVVTVSTTAPGAVDLSDAVTLASANSG